MKPDSDGRQARGRFVAWGVTRRFDSRRRTLGRLASLALGAALLAPSVSTAAECPAGFPAKPIRLVVPFPAGGTSDLIARSMSQALSQQMGQNWVVENRAGGGASIGTAAVVNAPADGYTLLLGAAGPLSMSPHITKLPYNVATQLMPLALVASVPNIVVLHPAVPANSLTDLIKLARGGGKPMSYGSAGIGTTANFAGELFKSLTKTDITHVPYKGTSAAVTDLIGGQIDLAIDNLPAILPHIKSGALKAVAVTGRTRSPAAPTVPTAAEAGLKDFVVTGWFGFLAPKGTPAAVSACLADKLVAVASAPDMQKSFLDMGAQPDILGPRDFTKYIEEESAKWGVVARQAKMGTDN